MEHHFVIRAESSLKWFWYFPSWLGFLSVERGFLTPYISVIDGHATLSLCCCYISSTYIEIEITLKIFGQNLKNLASFEFHNCGSFVLITWFDKFGFIGLVWQVWFGSGGTLGSKCLSKLLTLDQSLVLPNHYNKIWIKSSSM